MPMVVPSLLVLSLASTTAITEAPPRLFGLAVGYNASHDPEDEPLLYADDDAVQNGALLRDLGADHVVLTAADRDTQRLHEPLTARPPSWSELQRAVGELNGRMDQARAAGRSTQFFFFYTGHGNVRSGEGYINLADRTVGQSEFRALLAQIRADVVHVIVDACQSYFLLFERGPGGEHRPLTAVPDSRQPLGPNIGLFLSTSSGASSHEWDAYQGGIFSHQVRSGLRGGADADGDGALTYDELAAFIYSANRSIPNPKYRPAFFVRPPSSPLDRLRSPDWSIQGTELTLRPDAVVARSWVEDARGNRLIDFHPSGAQAMRLVLPNSRPLFLRGDARELEHALRTEAQRVTWDDWQSAPATVAQRGAENLSFALLFSDPFDDATVGRYRAVGQQPVYRERPWFTLGPALLSGALAASLVTGAVFTGLAVDNRAGVSAQTSGLARAESQARQDQLLVGAGLGFGLATAGLVTLVTWWLWPTEKRPEDQIGSTVVY